MSAETTEAPIKTDSTALVAVQTALSEFDKLDQGLIELETKYANVVYDVATPAGLAEALAARREIRDPRYRTEQIRKGAKAPVLALGKNIDERARYITDRLTKIEDPIDVQIKSEENRREALRQEAARKEAERQAAIDTAIDGIRGRAAEAPGKPAAEIATMIEDLAAFEIGEPFAEHKERAQLAKDITLSKLRSAQEKAVAQEAESQRLAAERAELARQRAEQDERARLQRAEQARLAAEDKARRDKIEADERASRERIEAQEREARAKREEEDRKAQALRDAEAARLKAERDELEERQRAARLAEEEQERAARAEQERVEREERERVEAVEAAKRDQERREQGAREAAEREERRKAAEISDGRAHLAAFVDRFGMVPEFEALALTIAQFLSKPPASKAATLAEVARPRRARKAA